MSDNKVETLQEFKDWAEINQFDIFPNTIRKTIYEVACDTMEILEKQHNYIIMSECKHEFIPATNIRTYNAAVCVKCQKFANVIALEKKLELSKQLHISDQRRQDQYIKTLEKRNKLLNAKNIAYEGRLVQLELLTTNSTETIKELIIIVNMFRSLPSLDNPNDPIKYNEAVRVRIYLNDKIEELDNLLNQK